MHKANILKSTSGLFLKVAREVAAQYPDIACNEMIVDNCCMQLVMNPQQFDVIVTTNLFGDIISDLCAGLVGGLGLAPGANIGTDAAIFEAVHGSAPDIAGKGIANPCALLLAACQMLDHLGMNENARCLRACDSRYLDCEGSGHARSRRHRLDRELRGCLDRTHQQAVGCLIAFAVIAALGSSIFQKCKNTKRRVFRLAAWFNCPTSYCPVGFDSIEIGMLVRLKLPPAG